MSIEAALVKARAAHASGNAKEAARLYQSVLALDAKHIEALNVTGMLLAEGGNFSGGLGYIERAIAADARIARSYFHRGIILEHLQRHRQALESYQQTLRLDPRFADAYFGCANLLQQFKHYEDALRHYDAALALNPRNPAYYNNKGTALKAMGRWADAQECYQNALTLNPHYAHAHNNLAVALKELGQVEASLVSAERAIALDEHYPDAYNNKAVALEHLGRNEEALVFYDRALALNPHYAEAYSNRGYVLQKLCRYDEALIDYDKAIALNFSKAEVYFNKGFALLLLGRFEEGWKLLEWRAKRADVVVPVIDSPQWTGEEDIKGKTLLLHAEQGLGDAIQFCRYVPMVQALGAKVVLQVQAPLIPLFKTLTSKPELVPMKEKAPHDYHCMLMSLPGRLDTMLDSVPADIPYLFADAAKVSAWSEQLGDAKAKRVGVVWAGNPNHKNDHNRSVPFETFRELFKGVEGIQFHCLQKDISASETQLLRQHHVAVHADNLKDFTDTSALLMHLDVVITVDTAVAHLAGALGRRVWILIPFAPDFRWLVARSDSPWYPTARLFRQSKAGDWASVIEDVKNALIKGNHGG